VNRAENDWRTRIDAVAVLGQETQRGGVEGDHGIDVPVRVALAQVLGEALLLLR
jgi:hypothetical protein